MASQAFWVPKRTSRPLINRKPCQTRLEAINWQFQTPSLATS
jgi:hypothetical protein